ncbi:MAG TPA: hypothetical protein VFL04_04630 [Rectinemataceae bacterium]|nr:hypothetical protein [Rectinemataceae bacterium]
MKQYAIKSEASARGGDSSLLELIGETEGGFYVRIVHRHEDWEDVKEDFMSQELFDTCLRTGYIAALSA